MSNQANYYISRLKNNVYQIRAGESFTLSLARIFKNHLSQFI
jgi:hypothetical protein